MATVQEVVNAAYNKSAKNRPGTITTDATELVGVTSRALMGLYAIAARVNPIYFSQFYDVAFVGGAWVRPVQLESIFRLERTSDGAEIVVVPFDDRTKAEPSKPAVYELAQLFKPVGNANDPNGAIRFWGSKIPVALANLADPIDPSYPLQHLELLIHEVAIYLALKDGRQDDVQALSVMRDAWFNLYVAHLEHATANLRSRFGQVRRFTTNTLVPLKAMLAGGG